jgi:DNA invertase Pin-like site-specific DNA recombinase
MKIGYARISTADQKLDLQLDALRQAGCEKLFHDVMTSTRMDRPGLAEAYSHLRKGDTLVVWRFDRLARSVKHLIILAEELKVADITLVSLHDQIDTTTTHGQFFFTVMAACAELERNLIVERTHAGLAAARARGRIGGRRPKLTRAQRALVQAAVHNPATSITGLAESLGVHRSTIYRELARSQARAMELDTAAD